MSCAEPEWDPEHSQMDEKPRSRSIFVLWCYNLGMSETALVSWEKHRDPVEPAIAMRLVLIGQSWLRMGICSQEPLRLELTCIFVECH